MTEPKPKPPRAADLADEDLKDDLKDIARQVAPHEYGHATSREFAIGKYSEHRRRRRYAIT